MTTCFYAYEEDQINGDVDTIVMREDNFCRDSAEQVRDNMI